MIQENANIIVKENMEFPELQLYVLKASIVEEYARILMKTNENEKAHFLLTKTITEIENQVSKINANEYFVYLYLLHKVNAEVLLQLNKLDQMQESFEKSNVLLHKIIESGDKQNLPFYLLNHWQDINTAIVRNHLLEAKIELHNKNWKNLQTKLANAWDHTIQNNKGINVIECCNMYFDVIDNLHESFKKNEIKFKSFQNILSNGLLACRSTDSILRKTRNNDLKIDYPYYSMIQRGLKYLLPIPDARSYCITLLYESLRIHDKYPEIYPIAVNNLFTKVMALIQLLREENQYSKALQLIEVYQARFNELKEKNSEYIVPFVEIQAQLVISTLYSNDMLLNSNSSTSSSETKSVPLAQQLKLTFETRNAVENLEYVSNYFSKRKNLPGLIRTLHSLAIIQTLQEEYSYAERDATRCIKLICSSFEEYTHAVEFKRESISPSNAGRFIDLIILKGSLLRILHYPYRALNFFKCAVSCLTTSPSSGASDPFIRVKDDISRSSDMIRCLEFMLDISETTLLELHNIPENHEDYDPSKIEDTKKFIKECKAHHRKVSLELNRLNNQYQKAHQKTQNSEDQNQTEDDLPLEKE